MAQARAARDFGSHEYGGAGTDFVCLGLASEALEYVDTRSRHDVGRCRAESPDAAGVGHRGSEERHLVPGAGHGDRQLRPDRTVAGSDARAIETVRHPEDDRYG